MAPAGSIDGMQLKFTEDELMREHDYAQPQVVAGHRLHGGFDAAGQYVSPRTALRGGAVDNWTAALRQRGGELFEANASLLAGARMPTPQQQKLLMVEGLGQTFWNSLTITGIIEGRGRFLADAAFPSFQPVIVEDISEMALGHIHTGLLKAHGMDEGGDVERGIGGHDVMWFALRDLAFGSTDYPQPEVPEVISRPDAPSGSPIPQLPDAQARVLSFLMNLLMIEFRAELGFEGTEALLRDDELFTDRRAEALEAADVVQRIRQDEEVHVTSLRLMLGEAASVTFKTVDGGTIRGSELIAPFWDGLVQWATVDQPPLAAKRMHGVLSDRIMKHADGARILERFDGLSAH